MTGVPFQNPHALFQGFPPGEHRHQFLVADGLHGGELRTVAPGQQVLHFVHKPFRQHLVHPEVDAPVQPFPVHGDAHEHVVVGQFPLGGFPIPLGLGLARGLVNLQGPDHPLDVIGMDGLRRRRVHGLEPGVQGRASLFLPLLFQLSAHRDGARGAVGDPRQGQGVDVQPCPPDDQGDLSPSPNAINGRQGIGLETGHAVIHIGLHTVDEVVGNSVHLLCRGLGRPHVQVLVNLHGVGGNDFRIQKMGQGDGSRRLP